MSTPLYAPTTRCRACGRLGGLLYMPQQFPGEHLHLVACESFGVSPHDDGYTLRVANARILSHGDITVEPVGIPAVDRVLDLVDDGEGGCAPATAPTPKQEAR